MRATFVMEQQVGHQSFYRNLRACLDTDSRFVANWVEITYRQPGSTWERIPALPAHLRGSMVGRGQVIRGLRRVPYDIAFFYTQVPAALGGALVKRRPYVLCTDITPIQYDRWGRLYGHRPDNQSWLARYKHRVNYELFRGAACIIVLSAWARSSLVEDYGVGPECTEVIPAGVDLRLWQPVQASSIGPLRILFVGGDFARKGGEDLLAAFRSLPAGSAELILVTRTPMVQGEGIFVFPNMQPNSAELVALCQSCDVFVLPSHAEAFGIAAVEASALALPVIAAAVGGLSDIVVDGETGFLIQPGDRQALAEHLRRLADDSSLRHRLGQAARQRAEARFDARANAHRIGTILCQAAGRSGT